MAKVSANRSCIPDEQLYYTITFAIQGIYGFASIFVYITNIYALRRLNHTIHKTFTRLYVASAIGSIVYFLFHYVVKRFLNLGYLCDFFYDWLNEPNWIVLPYRIATTYCPIMILVVYFIISLHRVSAVIFPMKSRQFWERHAMLFLCIGFLIPLIFMWFTIPCRGFAVIADDGGLSFEYERIETFMGPLSASFFSSIATGIFGTLTLINAFITFLAIKTRKIKKDAGLLAFEFLLCFFTLIYSASQGVLYFSKYLFPDPEMQLIIREIRPYAIDLFILPQAWTLFFCNKSIRRETYHMFGIEPKSQVTNATFLNSNRSLGPGSSF